MNETPDTRFFSTNPRLKEIFRQPGIIQSIPTCRLEGAEATESKTRDEFFRHNLHRDDLIPYAMAYYQDPFTERSLNKDDKSDSETKGVRLLIPKTTLVLYLQQGTDGFNGSTHGGMISTIIDEAMGTLIYTNHKVYSRISTTQKNDLPSNILDMEGLAMFTASMNIRFKAPLPTPSIVLVEATARDIVGRKLFIEVIAKGLNDEVYAACDGMWMSVSVTGKL